MPAKSVNTPGTGSAPVSTPYGGSGKGEGEGREPWEMVVGTTYPLYVFTARTCLELLPLLSPAQVEQEIKHLRALDASVHTSLSSKAIDKTKRNALHKSLTDSLVKEVDKIVNKLDTLVVSISRSVGDVEQQVDKAQDIVNELKLQPVRSTDTVPEPATHSSDGNMIIEPPVRFSDTNFANIQYADIEKSFDFDQSLPGNRSVCYFGDIGYTYGRISHAPAAYPANNPIFTELCAGIKNIDPAFELSDYTCLVTKYSDGNSVINMHSDDEKCIIPGSSIYTVSFGAERTLRLYNTAGPLQDIRHKLPHGSVHIMTKESQAIWKHGIPRESGITDGRISFTFRRLIVPTAEDTVHVTTDQQQSLPAQPTPDTQSDSPVRVLLITDSILAGTPTHLFEAIPNHICIKQYEPRLENFDKYSSQFEYSDVVIISMGINDLHKHGHTARSLADCIGPRIKNYTTRYPKVKFIFNSILLTRDFQWLNTEVKVFNQIFFELTRETRNFSFFESDRYSVVRFRELQHLPKYYASGSHRSNNGVHISFDVRKIITAELVNSVGYLASAGGDRFRKAEWLRHVTTRSAWAG